MCRALGCDHVGEDPRFATLAARQRNRPALIEVLRGEMAAASRKLSLAEAAAAVRGRGRAVRARATADRTARRSANRAQPGVQHASNIRPPARCATRGPRRDSAERRQRRVARLRCRDNTRARFSPNWVSAIASRTGSRAASSRRRRTDMNIASKNLESHMNFGFTEEQELLRDQVRRFMQDACPMSEVRTLMKSDTGTSPSLWRQAADARLVGSYHSRTVRRHRSQMGRPHRRARRNGPRSVPVADRFANARCGGAAALR